MSMLPLQIAQSPPLLFNPLMLKGNFGQRVLWRWKNRMSPVINKEHAK